MHLETVSDDRAFRDLRAEWDALLEESRQDGPFLRHDWARIWWEEFGRHGRLNVVTCREEPGGRLIGVLPLFTAGAGRFLPGARVRFLADSNVGSVGLTPFAHPDFEDAVFGRFAALLRDPRSDWDVIDLRFMDPRESFFAHLTASERTRVWDCGAAPRIALPGDWDTYFGRLARKTRQNVRRYQKKSLERGGRVEVIGDAADFDLAFGDFIRLHEARMREKSGPEYAVSPKALRFMQRAMRAMLDEGRLRLTFLVVEGRRVAVLFLFRYRDTMYFVQSGFDISESRSGVCRALLGFSIRGAIEEGCSTYDMLLGDQSYKSEWGATAVRPLREVHSYCRTPAASLLAAKDAVIEWRRRPRNTPVPAEEELVPGAASLAGASAENTD